MLPRELEGNWRAGAERVRSGRRDKTARVENNIVCGGDEEGDSAMGEHTGSYELDVNHRG